MVDSTIYGNPDGTYAKVIADSMSPIGFRLTTMEVQCHRFVLAEFNTHRKFSRNSASSRAIPVAKQIERVRTNPALPLEWRSEQKGMQGGEELTGENLDMVKHHWLEAADEAADRAVFLSGEGLHKSLVNRVLEPFMWHKIIVSSTEWQNFFDQRCSPLAQPEIRVVAEHMRDALKDSVPQEVPYGSWHLPYILEDELDALSKQDCYRVSSARCARVSYLTHDGVRDIEQDITLYSRLVSADPPHWSPLEHVATPSKFPPAGNPEGNFDGWTQLRHIEAAL